MSISLTFDLSCIQLFHYFSDLYSRHNETDLSSTFNGITQLDKGMKKDKGLNFQTESLLHSISPTTRIESVSIGHNVRYLITCNYTLFLSCITRIWVAENVNVIIPLIYNISRSVSLVLNIINNSDLKGKLDYS